MCHLCPPSTTVPRQAGTCPQCGYPLFENLTHSCPTAVRVHGAPLGPSGSIRLPSLTFHL